MNIYDQSIMISLWFIASGIWYDKNRLICNIILITCAGYNIIDLLLH